MINRRDAIRTIIAATFSAAFNHGLPDPEPDTDEQSSTSWASGGYEFCHTEDRNLAGKLYHWLRDYGWAESDAQDAAASFRLYGIYGAVESMEWADCAENCYSCEMRECVIQFLKDQE